MFDKKCSLKSDHLSKEIVGFTFTLEQATEKIRQKLERISQSKDLMSEVLGLDLH